MMTNYSEILEALVNELPYLSMGELGDLAYEVKGEREKRLNEIKKKNEAIDIIIKGLTSLIEVKSESGIVAFYKEHEQYTLTIKELIEGFKNEIT